MPAELPAIRRAVPGDAVAMDALAIEGIETYRSFAPAGWEPPVAGPQVERTRAWLVDARAYGLVAEAGGEQVGNVLFVPAMGVRRPVDDPRLAHLAQLFVRRAWWGSGLATQLLGRATAEAARREFTAMRLFSAAGQARGRRFYEREGWTAWGPVHRDDDIGLDIVEYRRPLP